MSSTVNLGRVQKALITMVRGTAVLGGIAGLLAGLPAVAQTAQSVALLWDANPDPGIVGYRVYYGTSSGNYSQTNDVGNVTGTTVSGLAAGQTYYFVVTDYNTAGLESLPSDEVAYTTATPAPTPTPMPTPTPAPTPVSGLTAAATPLATPQYVQGNFAVPQTSQATVTLPFAAAQAAGDLNVVVVGWNDTVAQVIAVTDAEGNAYELAAGPTVLDGVVSQAIYYAGNITGAAAGANAVTVTFSTPAAYPDVRILEYSGLDPLNPVDAVAAAAGNGATSASGALTTTNGTDLLLAANTVQSWTSGPGAGFTQRLLTSPDGDLVEDLVVSAAGSYCARALLGSDGGWVMQTVAFRAATQ
jgi:hypothetical protein